MAHTYASLTEAKQFLRDEGEAWGDSSTNNARALAVLESVSRRIDEWCARSAYGSGFGPRTGTNRYDGSGSCELDFADDLATVTSVTSYSTTGAGSGTALTADTDYYLRNQRGRYEPTPYRSLFLHGQGALSALGSGYRVTTVVGTWGYPATTRTLTPTTAEALDASETTIDVSALTDLSAGQTLLLDSEQVYVTATTDAVTDTIEVVRGVNGTTAATHLTALPIARYVYDASVVDATLRLFLRRWRARDAGSDGGDGGGAIGYTTPGESEDTILRRTVGHLRLNVQVAS